MNLLFIQILIVWYLCAKYDRYIDEEAHEISMSQHLMEMNINKKKITK